MCNIFIKLISTALQLSQNLSLCFSNLHKIIDKIVLILLTDILSFSSFLLTYWFKLIRFLSLFIKLTEIIKDLFFIAGKCKKRKYIQMVVWQNIGRFYDLYHRQDSYGDRREILHEPKLIYVVYIVLFFSFKGSEISGGVCRQNTELP